MTRGNRIFAALLWALLLLALTLDDYERREPSTLGADHAQQDR